MKYWLMKSEPLTYSIDHIKEDQVECWEGVRNYQARNFIRDEMKIGDLAIFYHSNTKPPGAAGVVEIYSKAYPDNTSWDANSKYFDAKSSEQNPRWWMVDVKFIEKFNSYVPLSSIRSESSLQNMMLLKKGMRLSIQPIEKDEFYQIQAMGRYL